ncbi:UHRF1-binding protein 1-like, partial [Armadillidium nasatum]
MAGIIKNQILKHLSKFAKNLSSNSINVNTLRGEGELFNLELNEKVLTDLLELPNWMLISEASVNRVSIKIQWTKLKATPIHLSLDEVYVQMETCQDLRPHGPASDLGAYRSGSKYGFVEKVIDGMTVTINSVYVKFNSPSFTTSFQLMWHTLKIEAKSLNSQMTPIRLITNQSCCRITVKKKLSDCSVVGCRLVVISEDIVWVLTDSQILSAYHLVESLSGLIKKATEESQKAKAARKLEQSIPAYYNNPLHSYGTSATTTLHPDKDKTGLWNSVYTQAPHVDQNSMQKFQIFKKFDVVETSYHFYSEKIDLHFCDDPGSGRSSYPSLEKGGTIQVNIMKIKLDYYPYHLALGDRTHWTRYQESSPYEWTKASLNNFKNSLHEFFNSKHSQHTPLGRASPHTANPSQLNEKEAGKESNQPTKAFISNQYKRLMSTCFLLTCKNLIIYKVALSKRKCTQVEMLTSDRTRLCLPEGTSFVHIEFSSYYYPGGLNFPVPPPKIYTHVSPFKLDVDLMSCLWLNAFACNLKEKTLKSAPDPPYIDIHTEILMPRIIVKPIKKAEKIKGRPRALQILTSRLIISNVRPPDPTDPGSKAGLFTCLEEAQKGPLFFASGFPSRKGDKQPIPSKFLWHAE